MSLCLASEQRATMERHGETTYPHEGCGLLIGRLNGEEIAVMDVRTVDNAREDARHNRYTIAPADVLRAERAAEDRGLDLVGFFHSHPDAPAEPSNYDLAHASWPGFAYVIVAVRNGRAVETRAWRLRPDRSRFDEMNVVRSETNPEGGIAP